jgi:hypothetical protein
MHNRKELMDYNLEDMILKSSIESEKNRVGDIYLPKRDFQLLGISFFWNKKNYGVSITSLDTSPYSPPADNPLVFIHIGKFEMIFFNRTIWRFIRERFDSHLNILKIKKERI